MPDRPPDTPDASRIDVLNRYFCRDGGFHVPDELDDYERIDVVLRLLATERAQHAQQVETLQRELDEDRELWAQKFMRLVDEKRKAEAEVETLQRERDGEADRIGRRVFAECGLDPNASEGCDSADVAEHIIRGVRAEQAAYDGMETQVTALRTALRTYGRHIGLAGSKCDYFFDGETCSCGFLAALAAQEPQP